jgi:hypothetical protein
MEWTVRENSFRLGKYDRSMKAPDMDYREGISLGIFLTSSHIYGLPERADTFLLKDTT